MAIITRFTRSKTFEFNFNWTGLHNLTVALCKYGDGIITSINFTFLQYFSGGKQMRQGQCFDLIIELSWRPVTCPFGYSLTFSYLIAIFRAKCNVFFVVTRNLRVVQLISDKAKQQLQVDFMCRVVLSVLSSLVSAVIIVMN